MIYLFIMILLLPTAWFANVVKRITAASGGKRIFLIGQLPWILMFTVLSYFMVFRDTVGSDYVSYRDVVFPSIQYGKFVKSYEWLFTYLVEWTSRAFNNNSYYVFAVISLITALFLVKSIQSQSKGYTLSLALVILTLFFSFSLSGIRQALAGAIALYAMNFLKKQRLLFFGLVFISSGIHSSGIVYLLLFFLVNLKISKRQAYLVAAIFLMILPFSRRLLMFVSTRLGLFNDYWGSGFDTGSSSSSFYLIGIALLVVLLLSVFKGDLQINGSWEAWTFVLTISIALVQSQLPTPLRSYMIFTPLLVVAVPNVISKIKDAHFRVLAVLIILGAFGLFFLVNIIGYNLYGTLPFNMTTEWLHN